MAARLSNFRPVGSFGSYPTWLTNLKRERASGVYVIKGRQSGKILYVGESHTGNLYSTLTRHFQHWSGFTAGFTVPRNGALVAIRKTTPAAAIKAQNILIKKLKPLHNSQGIDEEIDTSFNFGLNVK